MRSLLRHFLAGLLTVVAGLAIASGALGGTDPLPSWSDGPVKREIIEFVQATTDESSPTLVPPAERIATFASVADVKLPEKDREGQPDWQILAGFNMQFTHRPREAAAFFFKR